MMITELSNNEFDAKQLIQYLEYVDKDFGIPLSAKVDLEVYARKLLQHGHVLVAKEGEEAAGVIGFYSNDTIGRTAHWPLLSVKKETRGKGYAKQLIAKMISVCRSDGMERIQCDSVNPIAVSLYKSFGFRELRTGIIHGMKIVYLELLLEN